MSAVKKSPVVAKSAKKMVAAKATRSAPVAAPVAPVVKPAAKPVAAATPLAAAKAPKPAKVKKPKLVRDSFTIPKDEYSVLDDLKQRAGRLSSPAKKSELLRAGVKALAAMPDAAFLSALRVVPVVKTGRPSKG